MAAEVQTAAFLDELERHQLLSPAQLKEAYGLWNDLGTDAKNLAAELMRRDWLTPFQVNQVFQGRGAGLKLGPYVLLKRLGQGGMGEVFKARHSLMDRLVALKVIRADRLDQPDYLGRFRREMQAAAKLTHPNVVLAHDAALAGEVYFLAMEYIEGADLAQLLKQHGKLSIAQACDCIRQGALGLQHAHERGLVHRDIKPSNLILANSGNVVKLLDLGLARLRTCLDLEATTSGLTREGAVMGTPDYIAPEQAVDPRTADIRADIYSLGCTLYHLLTGRPPFPGGTLTQKLLKHQQAEPEEVESLIPAIPSGLAKVVRKMMAKQPQDRYQFPHEVADALVPFAGTAAESPVEASPEGIARPEVITTMRSGDSTNATPPREETPPIAPRPNRILLLAAFALGLVFILSVLIVVPMILLPFAWRSHPISEERTERSPDLAASGSNTVDVKPDVYPEGKPPEVGKLPQIPADGPAHLIKHLKGHTGTVQCLAFSPDGKRLASGADDHQARLWDGLTGESRGSALKHSAAVRALAFSPDGKRLAAASHDVGYESAIKLWDAAACREIKTLHWEDKSGTPSLAEVHGLAFSTDGKRLASGGGPLRLWNLDNEGEPTVLIWQKTLPSYFYGVGFSPDGKLVAAGCHEMSENVRVWKTDGKEEPILLQGKKDVFSPSHSDVRAVVAFAAGGKLLVRVTGDRQIGFQEPTASVMLWDVDLRQQQITLRDTYTIPGGAVFALASDAGGHLRVAVAAGNPGLGGFSTKKTTAFEVALWDGDTGKVRVFDTGHKANIMALAFSPDGTRLATGSEDQTVKLWDLAR